MNTVEQAHYFGSSGFYGTVTAVFRCLVGGGELIALNVYCSSYLQNKSGDGG